MMDVSELCYSFVEDVSKRTKQMDIQYLLRLKILASPRPDCAVQSKRGIKDHIKRRQNLRRNELKK